MELVDTHHAISLREQWAQNQARYPFYTSFVEGVAYFGFHAGVLHQEGIDTNAQADYEQLCYLNWADVFVSDEQGFLRSAFNDLWKPRKKHCSPVRNSSTLLSGWRSVRGRRSHRARRQLHRQFQLAVANDKPCRATAGRGGG
jgi:hypothetical protein